MGNRLHELQIRDRLFLTDMPFVFVGWKKKRLLGHKRASMFMCFKSTQLLCTDFEVELINECCGVKTYKEVKGVK
jgi:hypothetical protein